MNSTEHPISLQDFLSQFPWEKEVLAGKPKPLDFLWHYDLKSSAEELWPHISDTSSFNKRMQLPVMNFEEKNGRMFGTSVNAGIRLDWEEVPWQWEYAKGLHQARIYSRGFAHYVRARYLLESLPNDGTRMYVYFGWIPRSLSGRILLKVGMKSLQKSYARVLGAIDKEIQAKLVNTAQSSLELQNPVDLNLEQQQVVKKIQNALAEKSVSPATIDVFARYIATGPEDQLFRIQVRDLSEKLGLAWKDILIICLYLSKAGLFNLSWDVVCPHCRGAKAELKHLGDIPDMSECEACEIDFSATELDNLEITFRPHETLRRTQKLFFCAAEPARKPHIFYQQTVEPGSEKLLDTRLPVGLYRTRILGEKSFRLLQVEQEAKTRNLVLTEASSKETSYLGLHPVLTLRNNDNNPHTFVIEKKTEDQKSIRPGDLFLLKEFRELFPEEKIGSDIQLEIGQQTIMFTDIVGSTRFYREKGDTGAFNAVRQHFVETYRIVNQHKGVVVKSIGDSVMAAFSHPLDALIASLDLQTRFERELKNSEIRLRISLHTGQVLAVNLDTGIDYFGTTVNLAAKIQAVIGAAEIGVTREYLNNTEVKEYLQKNSLTLLTRPLKSGFSDVPIEVSVLRV
ncbi:MAG: adenylate/guanylate cyclase domain-containing protein [Leptospiraceae bacterium]|nr:adenylate/guanylate cyclase domain-containing protein [Leptospiraceae bacterium]